MTITLQQRIDCVVREIGMRERVYPAWVRGGKMKPEKAEHEIAAMRAVLVTLRDMAAAPAISEERIREIALVAGKNIICNLTQRRGFDAEWDIIDADIQMQICLAINGYVVTAIRAAIAQAAQRVEMIDIPAFLRKFPDDEQPL